MPRRTKRKGPDGMGTVFQRKVEFLERYCDLHQLSIADRYLDEGT